MEDYTKIKPKKKNNAFFTAIIILLVIAVSAFAFFFIEQKINENSDWKNKIEYSDISTHENYTSIYINGNIKNISDKTISKIMITFSIYEKGNSNKSIETVREVYHLKSGDENYFNFILADHEVKKAKEFKEYNIKITGIKYNN